MEGSRMGKRGGGRMGREDDRGKSKRNGRRRA